MSLRCLMNGLEVNYPCSPTCALFGDCVSAFEAQKKREVRTIADQIRSMTDEELAKWLLTPADLCGQCDTIHFCTGCPQDKDARCIAAVIKYLKQPVEEG